jgi:chromosome segregation ATPase
LQNYIQRRLLESEVGAVKEQVSLLRGSLIKTEELRQQLDDELMQGKTELVRSRNELKQASVHAAYIESQRSQAVKQIGEVTASFEKVQQEMKKLQQQLSVLQAENDHLQMDYDKSMEMLEQHKTFLAEVTQERDEVKRKHSTCYQRQICGVGVEICQAPDRSVRVSAITAGGACWLEAIKSPNDVSAQNLNFNTLNPDHLASKVT